jgi:NAD(P)H-dependent flavin oxidoreductase YrpB (nitropropane dioxygenase family)
MISDMATCVKYKVRINSRHARKAIAKGTDGLIVVTEGAGAMRV